MFIYHKKVQTVSTHHQCETLISGSPSTTDQKIAVVSKVFMNVVVILVQGQELSVFTQLLVLEVWTYHRHIRGQFLCSLALLLVERHYLFVTLEPHSFGIVKLLRYMY